MQLRKEDEEMYLPALDLAGRLQRKIRKKGFELRYSDDLYALRSHARDMGYEQELTPHFDPDKFDLLSNQQFWLGLFKNDICVGMVACRRQPIGDTSLDEFARQSWGRYYGSSPDRPFTLSSAQQRQVKRVTGTLLYQGEFRIKKKLRSHGLGEALCSLARIVGFFQWNDIDWWYCFLKEHDWEAGIEKMIQIPIQIRQGLLWDHPPDPIVGDYVLGLMDAEGYRDWVDERLRRKN